MPRSPYPPDQVVAGPVPGQCSLFSRKRRESLFDRRLVRVGDRGIKTAELMPSFAALLRLQVPSFAGEPSAPVPRANVRTPSLPSLRRSPRAQRGLARLVAGRNESPASQRPAFSSAAIASSSHQWVLRSAPSARSSRRIRPCGTNPVQPRVHAQNCCSLHLWPEARPSTGEPSPLPGAESAIHPNSGLALTPRPTRPSYRPTSYGPAHIELHRILTIRSQFALRRKTSLQTIAYERISFLPLPHNRTQALPLVRSAFLVYYAKPKPETRRAPTRPRQSTPWGIPWGDSFI